MRKTCVTCARFSIVKGCYSCDLSVHAITGIPAPAEVVRWDFESLPGGYLMEPEHEQSCEGQFWEQKGVAADVKKKPLTPPKEGPREDEIPF